MLLTTLSYSAGVQSHALLEMLLRGDIEKPKNFLVLNADPGMENSLSYEFVAATKKRCADAGIDFITAPGPNLFQDLTTFRERKLERLDNPPLWTKSKLGKRGRLKQLCTSAYKIAPIRRALRRYLNQKFGVSLVTRRPPPVEIWIGFAADEAHRCQEADVKYTKFRWPLIELGMDRLKVEGYYLKHGIEKPPRSVCNACFANGLKHFEDMYQHRPDDWDQAVAVDESIRDLSQFGVEDECYVSSTLIPLKDLPKIAFKKYDADYTEHRCNSGVCFL